MFVINTFKFPNLAVHRPRHLQ